MALDGVTLFHITQELKETLVGSSVDKIQQSNRFDLILTFRMRKSPKLLLSANPSFPFCSILDDKFDIPMQAPMFCMLLRKHLGNARLLDVFTEHYDRVINFTFQTLDEFSDVKIRTLVFELLGRHTNIILLNEDNIILDSLVHVDHSKSRTREILPARPYQPIMPQEKPTPEDRLEGLSLESLMALLQDGNPRIDKALLGLASGISPQIVQEILYRSHLSPQDRADTLRFEDENRLLQACREILTEITEARGKAYYYPYAKNNASDCHPLLLSHLRVWESMESLHEALAKVYRAYRVRDQFQQKQSYLSTLVSKERKKKETLRQAYVDDLELSREYDTKKLHGELLLSQMYQVQNTYENRDAIRLLNYYDENLTEIEVPLDPRFGLQENAQRKFKQYNKEKETFSYASKHLEEVQDDLDYLVRLEALIDQASSVDDLDALKEEANRLLPKRRTQNASQSKRSKKSTTKHKDSMPLGPRRYRSSDGFMILAGRNNYQNDQLSLRQAQDHDLWLHAQNRAGAHIIIITEGKEVPENTLVEAAEITAFLSRTSQEKMNHMQNTMAIDYTLAGNVRKAKGQKPGLVIYDKHKTLVAEALEHSKLRLDD